MKEAITNSSTHQQSEGTPKMSADVTVEEITTALKDVYDPEIPVDIYELGLIYEIEADEAGLVKIVMTLTSPMCPVAETLPPEVEAKARGVKGVKDVALDLVWEPAWTPEMMSDAARLELGM